MAYYSLPRLERINTTMTFESSIFDNSRRWLSFKIYLFYKFYIKFLLKKSHPIYYNIWLRKKNSDTSKLAPRRKLFLKKKHILKYYIYNINSKFITFVIYKNLQ